MQGSWREALLDLLFPGSHFCYFCAKNTAGQKIKGVCGECGGKILSLERTLASCRRCGYFAPVSPCPNCLEWEDSLKRVITVVPYEGAYREMIQSLKYQGKHDLAIPLGMLMAEKVRTAGLVKTVDIIIPVPLHPLREKERGYNQSLWLAETIGRRLKLPLQTDALIRRSYLKTQTGLGKNERVANMAQAFCVIGEEKILNKNILLVDDIITTGATLLACAGVLRQKGAREINGVTWAAGSKKNLSEPEGNRGKTENYASKLR